MLPIRFTIMGQPFSKANSRRIVTLRNRPASIKSARARSFEASALPQIPVGARQRINVPVRVSLWIWYESQRPDLDESLVLDILQDRWVGTGPYRVLTQAGVYTNDRLVREKHIYHGIDREHPRVQVEVEVIGRAAA